MKILYLILSLFLISCGGGSDTPVNPGGSQNPLVGAWRSNCFQSSTNPENIWAVLEYYFTETEISNNYTYFSDQNCSASYNGSQNLWPGFTGTYTELPPVLTTSGVESGWYEVTYNVTPPLPTDLVVEMGFFVVNDQLNLVVENNGSYVVTSVVLYRL